jgi:hypothetical protein
MQDGKFEGKRLPGWKTAFLSDTLFLLAAVGSFK